jgi:hypothetical protein
MSLELVMTTRLSSLAQRRFKRLEIYMLSVSLRRSKKRNASSLRSSQESRQRLSRRYSRLRSVFKCSNRENRGSKSRLK